MNIIDPPRYETRAAIDRLDRILQLSYMDWMQDWDIQLADSTRLTEFCDLYNSDRLTIDDRFALMRLIVASLDELLRQTSTASDAVAVQQVEQLLRRDFILHLHTLHYWRLHDEVDPKNGFAVTPLLRQVWQECFMPEYQYWLETEVA